MKNWNTSTNLMSKEEREIWSLVQKMNYGLDGEKLSLERVKKNWSKLIPNLIPAREKMYKWLIWKNKS